MVAKRRLSVYKQFKEGQKRILVATDLVGRGIDIERVNIVINYDMPETDDRHGNGADTYLHRVRLYHCFFQNAKLIHVHTHWLNMRLTWCSSWAWQVLVIDTAASLSILQWLIGKVPLSECHLRLHFCEKTDIGICIYQSADYFTLKYHALLILGLAPLPCRIHIVFFKICKCRLVEQADLGQRVLP